MSGLPLRDNGSEISTFSIVCFYACFLNKMYDYKKSYLGVPNTLKTI